jgi:beta-carotene 3-hydroxylase
MTLFIDILLVIGTFACMEVAAWSTHKFVMHRFLWFLHEDHHQPRYNHIFEKNDAFFVFGALPSIALFIFGLNPELNYKFFIALGILLYGITYFLIHDVLIHRRFNWFAKTKNRYLIGLRKAHKIHHKHLNKENGECFGMLYVPKKYFQKSKRFYMYHTKSE